MAVTLELLDETGDAPVLTGDTATLSDSGDVTYQGDGVRNIIGKWLKDHPAAVVFENAAGWSNGYATLRERE